MSPTITSISNLEKLEEIKSVIRALLISMGSKDVTLQLLANLYKEEEDKDIPFKDFNYTSLKDFLKSMPDVVRLDLNEKNQLCAYHINTKKSKHISDLVSKAKKHPDKEKQRAKYKSRQCNNTIDPSVLYKAFTKLLKIANNHGTRSISKNDVLSEITESIGLRMFYEMDNLNRQLNELTHILTYDDDYIYFKNNSNEKFENHKSNKKGNNSSVLFKSLSDFIRKSTKVRLQKLIENHTEGIWCAELSKLYRQEYGLDLEYNDLGFNSIIEFINALPEIFTIVNHSNKRKLKVIDSRISIDDYLNHQNKSSISNNKLNNQHSNDIDALPKILSSSVSKTLIPDNVMAYGDTVNQISVVSLLEKKCSDVIITDVYSPSLFWVTLHKNRKKIKNLMIHIGEFYSTQDLHKYIIPTIVLQPGLHVACVFAEMWHRGVIKKIKTNDFNAGPKIVVFFYDYGTISSYKPHELYYLEKRFSNIPAQAIPCSLHNVQPLDQKGWVKETNIKFSDKVLSKSFVLTISSINEENNSMAINLLKINDNTIINEWIKKNQLAKSGIWNCHKSSAILESCQKSLKNTIQRDPEHIKDMKNMQNKIHYEIQERKHSNLQSMSFTKKLEAVRKYKERMSSSQDTSYPNSVSNDSFEEKASLSSISITSDDVQVSSDNCDYVKEDTDLKGNDVSTATNSTEVGSDSCDCSEKTDLEQNKVLSTHGNTKVNFDSCDSSKEESKRKNTFLETTSVSASSLDSDDASQIESYNNINYGPNTNHSEILFKSCDKLSLQFVESNASNVCDIEQKKVRKVHKKRDTLQELHYLIRATNRS